MSIKPFNSRSYNEYKRRALKKGRAFELTPENFTQLINSDCHYCGEAPRKCSDGVRNGVDRVNNDLGYIYTNVISCCTGCNRMKGKSTYEEFLEKCRRIVKRNDEFKTMTPLQQRTHCIKSGYMLYPLTMKESIELGEIKEDDLHYDYLDTVIYFPKEVQLLKECLVDCLKQEGIFIQNLQYKIKNLSNDDIKVLYKSFLLNNEIEVKRLVKLLEGNFEKIDKKLKFKVKLKPLYDVYKYRKA